MCVDDYQFRHRSAVREKICRRFIFRDQDQNERVFLVNISQFQYYNKLRLCEILMHLAKKGLNIKDNRFHMPQFDITIESGDYCLIPFSAMIYKSIIFNIQPIEEENVQAQFCYLNFNKDYNEEFSQIPSTVENDSSEKQDSQMKQEKVTLNENQSLNQISEQLSEKYQAQNSVSQEKELSKKKPKCHQKTIMQALTKTKQWRWIHQYGNLSLKNAANKVGISKKTLDDYFLVLRVGQQLNYDFQSNLDRKIGHLRHFIRNHNTKVHGRMNKNINSFSLIPDPNIYQLIPITKKLNKMEHIQQQLVK